MNLSANGSELDGFLRPEEWERVRRQIVHDWIRNRLGLALARYANVLSGRVVDEDAAIGLQDQMAEWPALEMQISRLIHHAMGSLSPLAILKSSIGAPFEEATRQALRDVVEMNWIESSGIVQLTERATTLLCKAGESFRALGAALSALDVPSRSDNLDLPRLVETARLDIRELGDVLGHLGAVAHR